MISTTVEAMIGPVPESTGIEVSESSAGVSLVGPVCTSVGAGSSIVGLSVVVVSSPGEDVGTDETDIDIDASHSRVQLLINSVTFGGMSPELAMTHLNKSSAFPLQSGHLVVTGQRAVSMSTHP